MPPTVRRLLLFAGGGPVLMELHLSTAGRPLEEIWQQAYRDLVAALDEDGDRTTSWEELMDQPALYQLHAGEQLFDRPAQRQLLVRTYDRNSDQVVQAEELQRLLGRHVRTTDLLVVRAAAASNPVDSSSGLWRWLDQDADNALSPGECDQARMRLRLLDADADGILWPADFAPPRFGINSPLDSGRGLSAVVPAAVAIRDDTNWVQLWQDLLTRYTYGGELGPADFQVHGAAAQLDTDADGVIVANELEGLTDAPADIVLAVQVPDRGHAPVAAEGPTPTWAIETVRRGGKNAAAPSWSVRRFPHMLKLVCAASQVTFQVPAAPVDAVPDPSELLARADSDRDGVLSRSEYAATAAPAGLDFAALDRNANETIELTELQVISTLRRHLERAYLDLWYREVSDPLFWVLDEDSNQRLGEREVAAASARLSQLDSNQDQRITPTEIPGAVQLLLSQRRVPQMPAPEFPVLTDAIAGDDLPTWFTAMDVNGDGVLSRGEFLGPATLFEQHDSDQDAFLTAAELGSQDPGDPR